MYEIYIRDRQKQLEGGFSLSIRGTICTEGGNLLDVHWCGIKRLHEENADDMIVV